MFSMLLFNRDVDCQQGIWIVIWIRKKTVQNDLTVSYKHRTGRILGTQKEGIKHTWQVYVTSELKIYLFCFFTVCTMVWIFIAVKNRHLNIPAALKLLTTQNEPNRAKTKPRNQQPASTIRGQLFLNMSTSRQVLAIPYERKRVYLLAHFGDELGSASIRAARKANIWLHAIIVSSWKSRFETLNLNVSGTKRDVANLIFEHDWAITKHAVIGVSYKSKG